MNQKNKSFSYPSSIIQANLGIDLLLDVIKFGNHSLGLFGGVEGGANGIFSDMSYYNYKQEKKSKLSTGTIIVSSRVGLSLFLAQHHRIEFVTKIPVYEFSDYDLDENLIRRSVIYRPIQFMLGYKFVF